MSKSCIIWLCYKRKDTQMNIKATRKRMISCFAQIINDYVLGYKIPELVRHEKIKAKHKGKLSRFKLRNIYAIDSTTITLAYWCINWAKHRQHKAAVKVHMVANVANRLPHFCVYGKANEHDSKKEDVLFESLKAGDIGILDRAYNCFKTLHKQSERGVIFVVQLFALRRIYPSHHVAEKGSYAEPLVLWDSNA